MFTDLPCGPFTVIAADPPWMYQKRPGIYGDGPGANGASEKHYRTLTNEEILSLPVRTVAAEDAHLFLWFTNPTMYGGRFSSITPQQIAAGWGFTYRTTLTWVKTAADGNVIRNGLGWYFRGATEHVLYATRGKASIPSDIRESNVIFAPRAQHSAKPPEFYALVERLTPGPRLDLFARTQRLGWTTWGDEV